MSSFQRIVESIKNGGIKKFVVLTGAGMSTASGIPDFRSPGGLYGTLDSSKITCSRTQKESLSRDPTAAVCIELFKQNPLPYFEVLRPFILGSYEKKWSPTFSHYFLRHLDHKHLLHRLYTQNIDGLDRMAGVSEEKLVYVHGNISDVSCEFCGASADKDKFYHDVRSKVKNIYDVVDTRAPSHSSTILCAACGRPGVKPDTVLFGQLLPSKVYECSSLDFPIDRLHTPSPVDLMIIAGTSLTVYPAAGFPALLPHGTPRLVINNEPVGTALRSSLREDDCDCFLQGDCDSSFIYLASELGWLGEMVKYRDGMCDRSRQKLDDALKQGLT